jgi:hypothetical protein
VSTNKDDFEIIGSGSSKKDSSSGQDDFQIRGGGGLTSPSDNPVWRQNKKKREASPLRLWLTVIIIVLALAVLITYSVNFGGQTGGVEAPVVQPENGAFSTGGERGPTGPPGALPPPNSR